MHLNGAGSVILWIGVGAATVGEAAGDDYEVVAAYCAHIDVAVRLVGLEHFWEESETQTLVLIHCSQLLSESDCSRASVSVHL